MAILQPAIIGDDNLNSSEIMNIALEMAGFDKIPDDSEIYVHGDNIKKVLKGDDALVLDTTRIEIPKVESKLPSGRKRMAPKPFEPPLAFPVLLPAAKIFPSESREIP